MEDHIRIEVRLFATLRKFFPVETRGVQQMDLPKDITIEDFVDLIGEIDKSTLILMVDGRREKDFSKTLVEGSRVALFPPVGGG